MTIVVVCLLVAAESTCALTFDLVLDEQLLPTLSDSDLQPLVDALVSDGVIADSDNVTFVFQVLGNVSVEAPPSASLPEVAEVVSTELVDILEPELETAPVTITVSFEEEPLDIPLDPESSGTMQRNKA